MLRIFVLLATTSLAGAAWAESFYRNVAPVPAGSTVPGVGSNGDGGQGSTTLVATAPSASPARRNASFASAAPQATQSNGPVTWEWGPGSHPAWAVVDPSTGIVSGPASTDGIFSGLTLRATDAKGSRLTPTFSIEILPPPAVTLPAGGDDTRLRVGSSLDLVPGATGTKGVQTWSMASFVGTMPGGSGFNSQTGRISGPVTGAGSAQFVLQVKDGFDQAISPGVSVSLVAYPVLAFTVAPQDITVTVGTPVNRSAPNLAGLSGRATYALLQGTTDVGTTLSTTCSGLAFDNATGIVSGTPQSSCSLTGLKLAATDDGGGRANLVGTATSGGFAISVTQPVPSSQKFTAGGPNVVISNSGLTASYSSGPESVANVARAANPISGKGYFEVTIVALKANTNVGVGVIGPGTSLGTYIGSDPSGVATYQSGQTYYGGGTSFIGGLKQGDIVMVAYSAGEIWFGKNGTWGRNPLTEGGTGTGGANIPAVSLNLGNSVTANFSKATAYPVPAGYSTLP